MATLKNSICALAMFYCLAASRGILAQEPGNFEAPGEPTVGEGATDVKIPVAKESVSFTDYSNTAKEFEVAIGSIKSGDKILIVDEWAETGAQLKAAISLVEKCGGEVVGATCFNVDAQVRKLEELSHYTLFSLL